MLGEGIPRNTETLHIIGTRSYPQIIYVIDTLGNEFEKHFYLFVQSVTIDPYQKDGHKNN